MRALIVDDNPLMRQILEKAVSACGIYSIDYANNGRDALQRYIEKGYNLLILDENMPIMSGTQVLSSLQKENIASNTLVMMVTGHSDHDLISTIKRERLKVDDLIVKPFDSAVLTRRILALLARQSGKASVPLRDAGAHIRDSPLSYVMVCNDEAGHIRFTGEFCFNAAQVINRAAKEIQGFPGQMLVFDLSGVSRIDEVGLGALLIANGMRQINQKDSVLRLGDSPIRSRIISLGLPEIIPLDEA